MTFKLADSPVDKEEKKEVKTESESTKETSRRKSTKKESSSKKTTKKKSESKSTSSKKKDKGKVLGPQIKVYYGQDIRTFYEDYTWYFSIDDILTLAGMSGTKEFIDEKKEDDEYDNIFESGIKEYPFKNESEQEEVTLICVDKDTVMRIAHDIRRNTERQFPGSFPRWLRNVDSNPYVKEAPTVERSPKAATTAPYNPSEGG